ncbi:aspartate-semialdehyde dehydrogenase [Sphaeroforma arctica JP610]|uniref:Aspartate-semialdehyde dehydrogenase n=1 Tax=Sphaeroforma arctica JP610 TaxID=667725 RepID=A0A0L0FKY6_9EUKA|nr:aspartate-semialdehyde dehydrogenase [Sphaeroforma arctica JP610]KNC77121.1 aspartate-semialdehyde dehydrogenase [Sphaeroforma arctica JP610]|eukprot:XP_014151023.1 aspartate-semialdehyde dehydrogenase [Sphaeroforma arctica JP610]
MTEGQKIKVGVLGATGMVGQRFVQLLADHPWFELTALGASERSAGKPYVKAAVNWRQTSEIPSNIGSIMVSPCEPQHFDGCRLVFSGLDSSVAGEVETAFCKAGMAVFSNSRNHRYDQYVPLVVPTVNDDHLDIIPAQQKANGLTTGFIVTNANCSSTGLTVPLKVLDDAFGLEACMVTTMQAISGAGFPGVPSIDIIDNVVPYISGEEEKLEIEPKKILGSFDQNGFTDKDFKISAHCNRVAVSDGHLECLSVKLKGSPTTEEVITAMESYTCEAQRMGLPSAPKQCIVYNEKPDRPQPRLDRDAGKGYTVTVGRVRPCSLFDFKLTILSHNTILGAAGGALMNAELAKYKGLL